MAKSPPPRRPSWLPATLLLVLVVLVAAVVLSGRHRHPAPRPAPVATARPAPAAPAVPAPPTAKAQAPVFEDYSHVSEATQPPAHEPAHVRGLALILDDVGWDLTELRRALALPYTMAISVMPDAPHARRAAEMAHAAGHVVMLHMPMEPDSVRLQKRMDGSFLRVGMPDARIHTLMLQALSEVPYVQGVNNHMGSLLTSKAAPMAAVMQVCREKHLFFVDSRTSAASVAATMAARAGIPWASRQVFLDDKTDEAYLQRMWNKALACEQRYGSCVVIAHPHPKTIDFLARMAGGMGQHVPMLAVTDVLHAGSLASRGD